MTDRMTDRPDRTYHLALGSNLGDREANLRLGLERLSAHGTIIRISSFYETKPVGNIEQPDFLNAAAEFSSACEPADLLDRIKIIEVAAGRNLRGSRWSPRPLDIDILLCGGLVMATKRLSIPHPGMLEREFVLAPLAEIAPEIIVPGVNKSVRDLWSVWTSSHPCGAVS